MESLIDYIIVIIKENRLLIEKTFLTSIDYLGTFAFAISGIRLASTKQFDIFGAYVVGLITAIGGGTIRDTILDKPVFWTTQPSYFYATLVALLSTFLFRKYIVKMEYSLFIFDAVGLGLFTVVGISVSLDAGYSMFVAIILGTITGSAGGVLRDIILNEIPLLFQKDIYATACIAGGGVYYLCEQIGMPLIATQLLTMFAVIAIRVIARQTNSSIPTIKLFDFEVKKKK